MAACPALGKGGGITGPSLRARRADRRAGMAWASFSATRTPAAAEAFAAHGVRDRRARRRSGDQRADADRPRRRRPGLSRRERPLSGRAHPGARYVELPGARPRALVRPDAIARRDPGVPDRRARSGDARSGPGDGALHRHRRLDRACRASSATAAGATCSSSTTRRSGASSRASRRARSTPRATASSPIFDGPARGDPLRAGDRRRRATLGLEVRAGLHTGEVELADGEVGGIAVHIGARSPRRPSAGEVLVSGPCVTSSPAPASPSTTGCAELKGVPGEWPLFAVIRLAREVNAVSTSADVRERLGKLPSRRRAPGRTPRRAARRRCGARAGARTARGPRRWRPMHARVVGEPERAGQERALARREAVDVGGPSSAR